MLLAWQTPKCKAGSEEKGRGRRPVQKCHVFMIFLTMDFDGYSTWLVQCTFTFKDQVFHQFSILHVLSFGSLGWLVLFILLHTNSAEISAGTLLSSAYCCDHTTQLVYYLGQLCFYVIILNSCWINGSSALLSRQSRKTPKSVPRLSIMNMSTIKMERDVTARSGINYADKYCRKHQS